MCKKKDQLGMPYGTAVHRLKKSIMFDMAKKLNLDNCHCCGSKILKIENFSIEHKEPWLDSDNPSENFYNLENIAFSHLNCNIKNIRRKYPNREKVHPSYSSYRRGCRCDGCVLKYREVRDRDNARRRAKRANK